MKLIVLKENLKEALNAVSRATSDNTNLPILKNVLIKTFNNKIIFSATNLELAVTCSASGKIIEDGGVTIPFSVLSGIVNDCDSERVNLDIENNILSFKTDNYEAKIQGLNEEEFPIIPKIEKTDQYLNLDFNLFKEALLKIIGSIQISDIRPELGGIFLDFQLTQLKLAGTDSFRLSEKTITDKNFKHTFSKGFKIIIPLKTIQELNRVGKEGNLNIYIDSNQILFKNGDLEIISRLIDGQYPDYVQIIPKDFETDCVINKDIFLNAVKLVSNFTGRANDIKIKVKEGKKVLEVYSTNQYFGENRYLVPAKIKGEEFETAFNWRYLLEGLKNFSSEEIIFRSNGNSRPTLIKSGNDDSYF